MSEREKILIALKDSRDVLVDVRDSDDRPWLTGYFCGFYDGLMTIWADGKTGAESGYDHVRLSTWLISRLHVKSTMRPMTLREKMAALGALSADEFRRLKVRRLKVRVPQCDWVKPDDVHLEAMTEYCLMDWDSRRLSGRNIVKFEVTDKNDLTTDPK